MMLQMLKVIFDEELQAHGLIASDATRRFEPILRYSPHYFSK